MTTSKFFPMALTALAALVASCASTNGNRSEPSSTAATATAQEPAASSQSSGQGQGMGMGQGQGMGMGQGQGMGMGHGPGMAMMKDVCPMQVQGTTVTSSDVEGGVAVDFKTTGDVAELRRRVQRMADMHNQHGNGATMGGPGGGGMGGGMMGGGHMMGGAMGMMPAASASVEEIDGGARLVLRPKDPAQLEALRNHARMGERRMASGECPMMSGSQGAATPTQGSEGVGNAAPQPAK